MSKDALEDDARARAGSHADIGALAQELAEFHDFVESLNPEDFS